MLAGDVRAHVMSSAMSLLEAIAIFVAGIWAGAINTVVGSGTLVTFPVLLACGYPPVTANATNSLGLVTGSLSGAFGYRAELRGQRARLLRFGFVVALGSATGAALLFVLPASAFEAIVPVFIAIALVLVALQPRIARVVAAHRHPHRSADGGRGVDAAVFATGIYGGYFGAAQGILQVAIFGVALDEDVQRINALKNALTAIVNLVAAIVFLFIAHLAWGAVALLAAGATIGGQIGARVGRRLPPNVLRGLIVVVGLAAIARLLLD
jgi:uncharacterized membrane protein YfcA